jgi:diguanylate cyclase (GGDEF)-like protein
VSAKVFQRATIVALVLAALGGALAAGVVTHERSDEGRQARLSDAESRISAALAARAYYLKDVADMVGVHDDADVFEFSRYAAVRGRSEQAVRAVQWVRRSPSGELAPVGDLPRGASINHPLLIQPPSGRARQLADAAASRVASAAIQTASMDKRSAISTPVALGGGVHGFYLAVPIEAHRQSGEVAQLESRSAIVGLVDARAFLAQAFGGGQPEGVAIVTGSGPLAGHVGGAETLTGTVGAFGQRWTVAVSATALSPFERLLPWLIATLGLALATAVAMALRHANRRRDAALRDLEHSLGRVEHANRELEQAHAAAELRSRQDAVTGVFNRRHFTETLAGHLIDRRRGLGGAVLLIDLDHFKRVNDTHGHLTGDAVLRATAQRIAATLRESDCLARWGGEEFAILAPAADAEAALALGERVRAVVADTAIEANGITIAVTLSVGVVSLSEDLATADAIVSAADLALYEAKRAGRDCVRAWEAPVSARRI